MDEENLLTFRVAVWFPVLQATFTGLFFSGVVGCVVLLAEPEKSGLFVLSGFTLSSFVAWLFLLRVWLRLVAGDVLAGEEQVTFEPEVFTPSTVRVEVYKERSGMFIDLPCEPEQLAALAGGVVSGTSLAESSWCGSGRPFSKSQFHSVRNELVRRGLVAWRNVHAPSQGLEPTRVGRHVFERVYERSGNHLPELVGEDGWKRL